MAEPTMHMPRKWRDTNFGRRLFTEGWQDGLAGKDSRYEDVQAYLDLLAREGPAALTAYEDGYKAGQNAME